jgi:stearoyl-CoA desaturase (Delta-9 desaturase)
VRSPGGGEDVIAIEHPTVGRVATAFVTITPVVLFAVAIWRSWGDVLDWQDAVGIAVGYAVTGVGITVGFHRLFTHRSFTTRRWVRVIFAVLGSAAVEGPLIEWVANHRMHHRYSDLPGDPHSPHVGHGTGFGGAFHGLVHAQIGWIFRASNVASPQRYAPDLVADPAMRFIDRTFLVWVLAGLCASFGLGVALTGTVAGGLTGLLWGGAVRIMLLHHATFSVNSLCHYFGGRRFNTSDESRNLAWLAIPTLGEAWHNNHHAFPTSAHHGLTRWQVDPSGWLIDVLERTGLAWNVIRIAPSAQAKRRAPAM